MARLLSDKKTPDKVPMSKMTFRSPVETAGLVFLTTFLQGAVGIFAKAGDEMKNLAESVVARLQKVIGYTMSYEAVAREWVVDASRPTNPQTGKPSMKLEWFPNKPLKNLGPATIWMGEPEYELDGTALIADMKKLGIEITPDLEAALSGMHKNQVLISCRATYQNSGRTNGGSYGPIDHVIPNRAIVAADEETYQREVLKIAPTTKKVAGLEAPEGQPEF
jgi:hypothetical protein